jgi:hypothetical protein
MQFFSPSFSLWARPTPSFSFPSLFFFHAAQAQLAFFLFSLSSPRGPASWPAHFLPWPSQPLRPALSPFFLLLTSGTHLSGSSPTSSQTRARARVRPRHGTTFPARGIPGPHAKVLRPPYKAAALCPRTRKNSSRRLLPCEP